MRQESKGIHQAHHPDTMLSLLFGKTLLGQPDADLLLQRGAAAGRIHDPRNRQAIDLLGHAREHQHQGVHDEARRHTRAQDGNAVFLGQFVQFAGLLGIAVVRIEQLFGGGHDVDAALHQRVQGRQDFGQGRDGGDHGDVNVVVLLKIQEVAAHGNTEPLVDLDDLAEVPSLLGRINVKGCGNVPTGFLEQQPRHRFADGAQADLHHLHRMLSQRQPSPRNPVPPAGGSTGFMRAISARER